MEVKKKGNQLKSVWCEVISSSDHGFWRVKNKKLISIINKKEIKSHLRVFTLKKRFVP